MPTCAVCLDDFTDADGASCAEGHFVCAGCFDHLVAVKAEELTHEDNILLAHQAADPAAAQRLAGRIFCPCRVEGCESDAFRDAYVAKLVSDATFDAYLAARMLLPVAQEASKAFEEAQAALQEEVGALRSQRAGYLEQGSKLLAKQMKRQMPDARQCAQCAFGPVDHRDCADLQAHHGQQARRRRRRRRRSPLRKPVQRPRGSAHSRPKARAPP